MTCSSAKEPPTVATRFGQGRSIKGVSYLIPTFPNALSKRLANNDLASSLGHDCQDLSWLLVGLIGKWAVVSGMVAPG